MSIVVPYTAEHREAWDTLCDQSDDAWLWHRRDWFEYASAVAGGAFLADTSFLVEHDGEILAIAPCMAIRGRDGEPIRLGLADQPVPWPAFSRNLSGQQRDTVEQLVFEEYRAAARRATATLIELFGVVPAQSFYRAKFPPVNLPLKYGYTGTVLETRVIDLTQPVEALWRDVRKGHKSAIKAGQKAFALEHWVGRSADGEFQNYQELHALAAGRVTRSQATFDAMREWIRNGHGLLVGARQGARWIGFVYILMHQRGAFYASACNHPDTSSRLPVGHALLWEAILRCRERDIELLEMGLQTHVPPQAQGAHDKLASISLFKRGFGGFAMPRYHARLDLAPSSGAGVP